MLFGITSGINFAQNYFQVDYEKEKSHYINEKIPKGDYHDPAHTLNTTARAHYQSPLCNEQLNSTTTRFGCGKYTVAVGAGMASPSFLSLQVSWRRVEVHFN